MRYNAFISYSHAADGYLAPGLQRALQRFARPWHKGSALNVFRDKTDLSANPGLWSAIGAALGDAEFFILLASPDAASSHWVSKEIELWRQTRTAESMLLVLTSGELVWDDQRHDFDWRRTNAVPRTLSGFYREEPGFIDLRWVRPEHDLSLANPAFRDAVAELAAPLHGKSKAELESESMRRLRRTRRLLALTAIAMATLAIVSATGAFLAIRNARRADMQAQVALHQTQRADAEAVLADQRRRSAEARLLRDHARVLLENSDQSPDAGTRAVRSVLLSVEALRLEPTAETAGTLYRATATLLVPVGTFDLDGGASNVVLDTPGHRLAFLRDKSHLVVYDLAAKTVKMEAEVESYSEFALSGDGQRVAYQRAGDSHEVLTIADVEKNVVVGVVTLPFSPTYISLDGRGTVVIAVAALRNGGVYVVDPTGNRPTTTVSGVSATEAHISDDLSRVTVLTDGGQMVQFRADTGAPFGPATELGLEHSGRIVTISNDGTRAVTADLRSVQVWGASPEMTARKTLTHEVVELGRAEHDFSYAPAVAISGDGQRVAALGCCAVHVWRLSAALKSEIAPPMTDARDPDFNDRVALSMAGRHRVFYADDALVVESVDRHAVERRLAIAKPQSVTISEDAARVVFLAEDATDLSIWDAWKSDRVAKMPIAGAHVVAQTPGSVALSGDGRRVAVGSIYEALAVQDLESGKVLLELDEGGVRTTAQGDLLFFALDHRGSRIAYAANQTLTVRAVEANGPVHSRYVSEAILAIAFSADGALLATQADDTVRVWDSETLEERIRVPGMNSAAAFGFTPEGRLRVVGDDGSVSDWPTSYAELLSAACRAVSRNLTDREWSLYVGDQPLRQTCPNRATEASR